MTLVEERPEVQAPPITAEMVHQFTASQKLRLLMKAVGLIGFSRQQAAAYMQAVLKSRAGMNIWFDCTESERHSMGFPPPPLDMSAKIEQIREAFGEDVEFGFMCIFFDPLVYCRVKKANGHWSKPTYLGGYRIVSEFRHHLGAGGQQFQ